MAHPNIYPTVLLELPPRLKAVLVDYARKGQIDSDTVGYPFLISVKQMGRGAVQAYVARNGQIASIIMNPRARTAEPELSWDPNDGYRAKTAAPVQVGPRDRRERGMRESTEFARLVDQLYEG